MDDIRSEQKAWLKLFPFARKIIEDQGCPVVDGYSSLPDFLTEDKAVLGFTISADGKLEPQVFCKIVDVHNIKNQAELVGSAKRRGFPFALYISAEDPEHYIWFNVAKQVQMNEAPVFSTDQKYVTDTETIIALLGHNYADTIYQQGLWANQLHILGDLLLVRHFLHEQRSLESWLGLDFEDYRKHLSQAYEKYEIQEDYLQGSDGIRSIFSNLVYDVQFFPPTYEHFNHCFASLIEGSREKKLAEQYSVRPVKDILIGLSHIVGEESKCLLDPAAGIGGTFFEVLKQNPKLKGYAFEAQNYLCKLTHIIAVVSGLESRATLICNDSLTYGEWPEKPDLVVFEPPFGVKIHDREILAQSELFVNSKRSSVDAIEVMLERSIRQIAPGGHIVLLVTENILFTTQTQTLRDFLMETCHVRAIISLPTGALRPATGIKSSVLVLIKKNGERDTGQVFAADLKDVKGHTIDRVLDSFRSAVIEGRV